MTMTGPTTSKGVFHVKHIEDEVAPEMAECAACGNDFDTEEEPLDGRDRCETCASEWADCEQCGDEGWTEDMEWMDSIDALCCPNCADTQREYDEEEEGHVTCDASRNDRCYFCGGSQHPTEVGRFTEERTCSACALLSGREWQTLAPFGSLVRSPMRFSYGVEMEISEDDIQGASRVLDILNKAGLTTQDHLHPYHCTCWTCTNEDIAPQTDPTAAAEFITRILYSDNVGDAMTYARVTDALYEAGADVSGEVGAHTNIGKGITGDNVRRYVEQRTDAPLGAEARAEWRLHALLALFSDEVAGLASQGQGALRSYNRPPRTVDRGELVEVIAAADALDWMSAAEWGSEFPQWAYYAGAGSTPHAKCVQSVIDTRWLTDKGNRWEFRVWSGTKVTWRAMMAVEVSAAMVAFAESTTPLPANNLDGLMAHVARYLTPAARAAVCAQQGSL